MNYKPGQLFQSGFDLFLIIANCDETSCYAYEVDTVSGWAPDFTNMTHSWLNVCIQIV